jgi:hypothetical protein
MGKAGTPASRSRHNRRGGRTVPLVVPRESPCPQPDQIIRAGVRLPVIVVNARAWERNRGRL